MMKPLWVATAAVMLNLGVVVAQTNNKTILLSKLDLNRSGLEQVKTFYLAGDTNQATTALLNYYKNRKNVIHPDVETDVNGKPVAGNLSATNLQRANDALSHVFFIMNGYPPFDYGTDINWQYWPVKDNEVRWQLHRMAWWESMALTYANTKDERYAQEWVLQYKDWVKKNPLGLSADNDRFAWRSLEISERLELQSKLFLYFINSPAFDESFLVTFLLNYSKHADHLINNYSDAGNHLLFQAQRMVYGGTYFPELLRANTWQQSGIDKLNEQITVQVFDDGVQNELTFHYHIACVQIFYKALQMLDVNGISGKFPAVYINRLERMIMAVINFSFPDYTYPMFGDSWLSAKSVLLRNYKNWASVYPDNQVLKYFATDRQEGLLPPYTSNRLANAGIYAFRSGWLPNSTTLILKASRPAEWHSQPDNGTFELWVNGRNFTPDAGAYIYAGDASINAQREYFRQTRLHNTLTLDNKNLEVNATELQWSTSNDLDILVYENPSYTNLKHRRAVLFVDKKYFVIVDEAIGSAEGNVAIHYGLKEGEVNADQCTKTITTKFADKNNICIKVISQQEANMVGEESYVSYAYNQKQERPAFAVSAAKQSPNTVRFLSVIAPFSGTMVPPIIEAEFLETTDTTVRVKVSVDGQAKTLSYNIPN